MLVTKQTKHTLVAKFGSTEFGFGAEARRTPADTIKLGDLFRETYSFHFFATMDWIRGIRKRCQRKDALTTGSKRP